MFSYKIETYQKNQWQVLHGWARPFTDGLTLDDSLDSGKIDLKVVRLSKPLRPFTRVRISVYEAEDTEGVPVDVLHYLVESDSVNMVRMGGEKRHNHSISLIELTKLLERDICDTMTITNYLGHSYEYLLFNAEPTIKMDDPSQDVYVYQKRQLYKIPAKVGMEYEIFQISWLCGFKKQNVDYDQEGMSETVEIIDPDGNILFKGLGGPFQKITLSEKGTYVIKHRLAFYNNNIGQPADFQYGYATYKIDVLQDIPRSEPWTITSVVNRLLSAGKTRRLDIEPQKYVFDSAQADRFSKVLAPEFYFTRGTLFEALMTVGGFIHGIPRLVDNNGVLTVKFDLLGEEEEYGGSLPESIYESSEWLGNEYCGAIDSTVENLLNSTDKKQGAVTEPSTGGWRAVNSAIGEFRIENDHLEIQTDQPINQVTKLQCQYGGKVYDLTPYVYETSEYSVLSGYIGKVYPNSKGYALEYTSGSKGIKGLSFTLEGTKGDTFATQYAIVNILKALGASIDSASNLPNTLLFRIQYIPIVSSRVVQCKPYLTHPTGNILLYNQGGNTVESEYYGAHMKGAIARIGNQTTVKTYIFKKWVDMPMPGQKIGDEYIALVEREFERPFIKATVTTVPNFNKLAEYMGINNNYRLYDVSEKQSVDRYINYGESCVLSHSVLFSNIGLNNPTLFQSMAIDAIRNEIDSSIPNSFGIVSSFLFAPKGGMNLTEGINLPEITLATGSLAIGNSLVFYANFLDNFGAGYQSSYVGNASKRGQRLVPYSDNVGNISTAGFAFFGDYNVDPFNYPATGDTVGYSNMYLYADSGTIGILKDSREALHIVIQEHFQADDINIVVGKALTKYCPLVTVVNEQDKGKLYFLDKPINALSDTVDLTGISPSSGIVSTTTTSNDRVFKLNIPANDSGKTVKSWAIVNPTTGEIYVGENYHNGLPNGATPNPVYFNFLNNYQLEQLVDTII